MGSITTLSEFIAEEEIRLSEANKVIRLLSHIASAGNSVSKKINRAALSDILGEVGDMNIQGESVKKLDLVANDIFISALHSSGLCAAIASEENEDIIVLNESPNPQSEYLFCMDPLDGSSNIDVNIY